MKKNGAFGARLYSMFTKSVLIPALIAIFCFGVYSNYTVNEREEQNIEDILSSVSQNLEIQFQDIQNIEKAFYIYSEVYREAEALNNPALYGNYDELSLQELENSYSLTLTKLIHTSNQDVRAVVFFPVSGEDEAYCLGKDEGQLKSIEYPGYKEEPWYQKAVDQVEAPVFCGMHIPEYQTNKKLGEVYSYVRAVRNMDNRKVMGVIKIDVRGEFLVQTLSAIEQTDDSGLLILNNGEYFSSSRWLGALGEESLEVSGEGQIRWGNRQYRSTEREISGTGLTLAYLDSGSFLYQGLVPVMIVSILILLSGIMLAFINYKRQARLMIEDVGQIMSGLQRVEKGELDSHIGLREDSEFKLIGDAVDTMTDHLKEYIEREYLMEIQQQKAEYRALQSQINPHFLYNTLNGFVALNRMGEKKLLERSIIDLSRLFRYACSRKETAEVQEEVGFLENYLQLEKLKYEERLEYMIWIDEESRSQKIPKLLLQPIVENSIKHGMGDGEHAVMIRIMAETAEVKGIGKTMVLTVRDNGAGFDSGGSEAYSAKEREEGHVGVENVKMRAELFCRNAIFQCTSRPGEGTKTTIVFPCEERD